MRVNIRISVTDDSWKQIDITEITLEGPPSVLRTSSYSTGGTVGDMLGGLLDQLAEPQADPIPVEAD